MKPEIFEVTLQDGRVYFATGVSMQAVVNQVLKQHGGEELSAKHIKSPE